MTLISELNSRVNLLLYGCHNYTEQVLMLLPDAKHFIHRLTTFAQNLENNHGWLQLCCALQLLWVTLTGRIWVCTVHQALCQWKISRQHESHFLVSREKTRGSLLDVLFFLFGTSKSQKSMFKENSKNDKLRNHLTLKYKQSFRKIFRDNNFRSTKEKWVSH